MKVCRINIKFVHIIWTNCSNAVNYNDRVLKSAENLSLYFKIAHNTKIDKNEYWKNSKLNVLQIVIFNNFNNLLTVTPILLKILKMYVSSHKLLMRLITK